MSWLLLVKEDIKDPMKPCSKDVDVLTRSPSACLFEGIMRPSCIWKFMLYGGLYFLFLCYVTITYDANFLLHLVRCHGWSCFWPIRAEEGRFGPVYERLIHNIPTGFNGYLPRKSLYMTLNVFSYSLKGQLLILWSWKCRL